MSSRYDKIMQAQHDLRKAEQAQKLATTSKIKVPSVNVSEEAYKSAAEVAQAVGTDKVFKAKLSYYCSWTWLDGYSDYDSGSATVFLYAQDKEDAKSKIGLLLKVKGPRYSLDGDISEVSKQDAEAEIAGRTSVYSEFKELASHILTLPTPAMYDEMEKSINWAVNMLKKLKD